MLSKLQEKKEKAEQSLKNYENKIQYYIKELNEYGNKTFINYINNLYNPEKILNCMIDSLDKNSNIININFISEYIDIKLGLYENMEKNYINNNCKFNIFNTSYHPAELDLGLPINERSIELDKIYYKELKKEYKPKPKIKLPDIHKNMFNKNLEIMKYYRNKNIEYNDKTILAKIYYNEYCWNRDNHSLYMFCNFCYINIINKFNKKILYNNTNSKYNNIEFIITLQVNKNNEYQSIYHKVVNIKIDIDISNLFLINKKYDEINEIFTKNPNLINKFSDIYTKLYLIKENKLSINEVNEIQKTIKPNFFSIFNKIITKNKFKKNVDPPNYKDSILDIKSPPEYSDI